MPARKKARTALNFPSNASGLLQTQTTPARVPFNPRVTYSSDKSPDTAHDDDPNTEEVSEAPAVVMTCVCRGEKIGSAVYDSYSDEISVFQAHDDTSGTFAYQMLQAIKLHSLPDVIYVSSRSDDGFIEACKLPVLPGDELGPQVKRERQLLFDPSKASRRLLDLHVKGMPAAANDKEQHLQWLGTVINMQNTLQIGALSALIAILVKDPCLKMSPERADDDDEAGGVITVNNLYEATLSGLLAVDAASLSALQVFQDEQHPSVMGIGRPKEGFSVFGLMQKAVTPMGKRLLKLWFLRPLVNLSMLQDRHDTLQLLVDQLEFCTKLKDTMKKVYDVPRLLVRMQALQGQNQCTLFRQMSDSLSAMMTLYQLFNALCPGMAGWLQDCEQMQSSGLSPSNRTDHTPTSWFSNMTANTTPVNSGTRTSSRQPEDTPWSSVCITKKILANITDDIYSCFALIREMIDLEQQEDDMFINRGICERLDDMKHLYNGLPDLLTQVMKHELANAPAVFEDATTTGLPRLYSFLYVPQVGYVMQVTGEALSDEVLEAMPDYKLMFHTEDEGMGSAWHYQNERTLELNERFGDLLYRIQDLENSISGAVARRLLEYSSTMMRAATAVAELDCLVTLAVSARQLNLRRPTLTNDNVLQIKQGRHFLTENLVDVYVPNDTCMTDKERIQIVTGPNASGKSCYAKQVALIVYLAHVGSFVPAEEALIGLTDRILTRISSATPTPGTASTFMIDMSQLASMHARSTSRSLLIIDEFGKGTLASDGAALLCATLKHYSELTEPPKVIACTHFKEVFDERFLHRGPQLQFSTMQVTSEMPQLHTSDTPSEQVRGGHVFLYRLAPGHEAPSFGIHCAERAGISAEAIQRAHEVLEALKADQQVQPQVSAWTRRRDQGTLELVKRLAELQARPAAEPNLTVVQAFLRDCCKLSLCCKETMSKELSPSAAALPTD